MAKFSRFSGNSSENKKKRRNVAKGEDSNPPIPRAESFPE
jgi:hypothetical protein